MEKTTRVARFESSSSADKHENEAGARLPVVDGIQGLAHESSGWDVYNNEARKVDVELVRDWTGSLNFLLLFVSTSNVGHCHILTSTRQPSSLQSSRLLLSRARNSFSKTQTMSWRTS